MCRGGSFGEAFLFSFYWLSSRHWRHSLAFQGECSRPKPWLCHLTNLSVACFLTYKSGQENCAAYLTELPAPGWGHVQPLAQVQRTLGTRVETVVQKMCSLHTSPVERAPRYGHPRFQPSNLSKGSYSSPKRIVESRLRVFTGHLRWQVLHRHRGAAAHRPKGRLWEAHHRLFDARMCVSEQRGYRNFEEKEFSLGLF